ncbi:hypothetical protein MKW94_002750 [Papaver nudicaule]|uniref:C2H2-type domain-containing protein n=1 Tax=Papaver nudicaule TaxID=74823 RepID=A0AA41VXQ5_PAPNU|nr:hypothetical protein [Papaver nudicaule]
MAGNSSLNGNLNPTSDIQIPLFNLSQLHQKMDSLQQFIAESIDRNTLLGKDQMDIISNEITSAIHQVIVNGSALISSTQSDGKSPIIPGSFIDQHTVLDSSSGGILTYPNKDHIKGNLLNQGIRSDSSGGNFINPEINLSSEKLIEVKKDFTIDEQCDDDEDCEIVELDTVELLAEHVHFCEICGKGFKRDANLRMHMRAHGNQFKTLEALTKRPDKLIIESSGLRRKVRFSCPFVGCNRNKLHKKFKPLKSAVCVKNHFRRSHCPKMYSCDRCNKKKFSVLADLKSHLKHCGDSKWKCSCGTTFSRKDKLFGHVALFEGHTPAITEEVEKGDNSNGNGSSSKEVIAMGENERESGVENFFDGFQGNFGGIVHDGDNGGSEDCLRDIFESPELGTGMDCWFDFDM